MISRLAPLKIAFYKRENDDLKKIQIVFFPPFVIEINCRLISVLLRYAHGEGNIIFIRREQFQQPMNYEVQKLVDLIFTRFYCALSISFVIIYLFERTFQTLLVRYARAGCLSEQQMLRIVVNQILCYRYIAGRQTIGLSRMIIVSQTTLITTTHTM